MAEVVILIVDLIDGAAKSFVNLGEAHEAHHHHGEPHRGKHEHEGTCEEEEEKRRKTTLVRILVAIMAIIICLTELVGDCLGILSIENIRGPLKSNLTNINCSEGVINRLGYEQTVYSKECFLRTKPIRFVGVYLFFLIFCGILFFFELYGFQWALKQHRSDESDPKDVITRSLCLAAAKMVIGPLALNIIRLDYGLQQYPTINEVNFIVVSCIITIVVAPLKILNLMLFYQEGRRVYKWKKALFTKTKGPYWNCVPNVKQFDQGSEKKKTAKRHVRKPNDFMLQLLLILLVVVPCLLAIITVVFVPLDNSKRTVV